MCFCLLSCVLLALAVWILTLFAFDLNKWLVLLFFKFISLASGSFPAPWNKLFSILTQLSSDWLPLGKQCVLNFLSDIIQILKCETLQIHLKQIPYVSLLWIITLLSEFDELLLNKHRWQTINQPVKWFIIRLIFLANMKSIIIWHLHHRTNLSAADLSHNHFFII